MSDKHTETFGCLVIDPNNPCAIQMVDEDGMGRAFAYVHGLPIEGTHGPIDARRLAACWNACEGIPTKALEAGVWGVSAAPRPFDVDYFPDQIWVVSTDAQEAGHPLTGSWTDMKSDRGILYVRSAQTPTPASPRADILDQAKQAVTKDRAATHGDAERNFGLIAAYWSAHLDCEVSATDVAVMMGLLKLARAKSNPGHMDNWVDLAGYTACGGEIAGDGRV